MFIDIQLTPNPNTLKFILNKEIYSGATKEYKKADEKIPVTEVLFTISGIKSVLLSNGFVAISKEEEEDWSIIKPQIISTLMDFLIDYHFESSKNKEEVIEIDLSNPTIKKIYDIIEERIQPSVAMDGGKIVLEDFKDGIVYVSLQGACSGCSASTSTLKGVIERTLLHFLPDDVKEVREK